MATALTAGFVLGVIVGTSFTLAVVFAAIAVRLLVRDREAHWSRIDDDQVRAYLTQHGGDQ